MITFIRNIVISMRPEQWVKNLFVFAGLIFSRKLFQPEPFITVLEGFILFCLASSSVYLFNDIKDIEFDRQHPEKALRPLAAGRLDVGTAYWMLAVLSVFSLLAAAFISIPFFSVLATYMAINFLYSIKIKHMVILDIMCISAGFVLRVLAGTILAAVAVTDWLIICTITLSLFLGFSKRRHELSVTQSDVPNHRKVLKEYGEPFLDQMIGVATACTVMSYSLYTISPETVARFGTRNLIYTIPFVIYGIYRYLYLIHQKKLGGNPASAVIKDVPLLLNALLWLSVVLFIIY